MKTRGHSDNTFRDYRLRSTSRHHSSSKSPSHRQSSSTNVVENLSASSSTSTVQKTDPVSQLPMGNSATNINIVADCDIKPTDSSLITTEILSPTSFDRRQGTTVGLSGGHLEQESTNGAAINHTISRSVNTRNLACSSSTNNTFYLIRSRMDPVKNLCISSSVIEHLRTLRVNLGSHVKTTSVAIGDEEPMRPNCAPTAHDTIRIKTEPISPEKSEHLVDECTIKYEMQDEEPDSSGISGRIPDPAAGGTCQSEDSHILENLSSTDDTNVRIVGHCNPYGFTSLCAPDAELYMFLCMSCQRLKFWSYWEMRRHEDYCAQRTGECRILYCSECGRRYCNQITLNRHYFELHRHVHNGMPRDVLDDLMESHVRNPCSFTASCARDASQFPNICTACQSVKFMSRRECRRHEDWCGRLVNCNTAGDQQWQCSTCLKKFCSKQVLDNHITDEESHCCRDDGVRRFPTTTTTASESKETSRGDMENQEVEGSLPASGRRTRPREQSSRSFEAMCEVEKKSLKKLDALLINERMKYISRQTMNVARRQCSVPGKKYIPGLRNELRKKALERKKESKKKEIDLKKELRRKECEVRRQKERDLKRELRKKARDLKTELRNSQRADDTNQGGVVNTETSGVDKCSNEAVVKRPMLSWTASRINGKIKSGSRDEAGSFQPIPDCHMCPMCDAVLISSSELSLHVSRSHNLDTTLPPHSSSSDTPDQQRLTCLEVFNSRFELRSHKRSTCDKLSIVRGHCFSTEQRATSASSQQRPMTCLVCYKNFCSNLGLANHKRSGCKPLPIAEFVQRIRSAAISSVAGRCNSEQRAILGPDTPSASCSTSHPPAPHVATSDSLASSSRVPVSGDDTPSNDPSLQKIKVTRNNINLKQTIERAKFYECGKCLRKFSLAMELLSHWKITKSGTTCNPAH